MDLGRSFRVEVMSIVNIEADALTEIIVAIVGTGLSGTGKMVIDLDHVNITTTRLHQSVEFYTILGLRDGFRPDFEFDGAWMYCGDRAVVHLQCPVDSRNNIDDRLEADPLSLMYEEPGYSEVDETAAWGGPSYETIAKERDDGETPTVDHIAFRCPGVDVEYAKMWLDGEGIKYTYNNIPDSTLEQLFVIDPNNVRVELNFDSRTDK